MYNTIFKYLLLAITIASFHVDIAHAVPKHYLLGDVRRQAEIHDRRFPSMYWREIDDGEENDGEESTKSKAVSFVITEGFGTLCCTISSLAFTEAFLAEKLTLSSVKPILAVFCGASLGTAHYFLSFTYLYDLITGGRQVGDDTIYKILGVSYVIGNIALCLIANPLGGVLTNWFIKLDNLLENLYKNILA